MDRFPHLDDTKFPDIETVDVFKYRNEFDYTRYDYTQMQITMCAVPWDMGEAHIGNRTISGIGNVVWFGDEQSRDAWFAAIPDDKCLRFSTKYRDLHTANYIDLPIPYDIACNYNYIAVEYALLANDGSPVDYEGTDGLRKWFWFIREVEFRGANSTRIHLMIDAWQTFMYRVDITGMMLERGHAPMAATSVDTYLSDPLSNCGNLLAPDIDYGAATVARGSNEIVFNSGDMLALIVTTARPGGTWGTKAGGDWQTPGVWNNTEQGVPSYMAFCLPAENLSSFLTNVSTSYPQFVQTIKAIAFVNEDMVTLGTQFTFASTVCHYLTAHYAQNKLLEITKNLFGYGTRYENIAKLYTSPYAHIELTDGNGDVTEVRIEDTRGTLYLETCLNLVYPWLAVDGHITGIGAGARRTVKFEQVTERSIPIRGNWYETARTWNIPTFGVSQDAGTHNDYAEYYDRVQAVNDYTTAQANENANADTSIANTALQTAANSAINATSVYAASQDTANINDTGNAKQAWDAGYTRDMKNAQSDATMQSAAIGLAGSVAGGAVSGAFSGGVAGAIGGLVSGAISGAAGMAQGQVSVNLNNTQAETTVAYTANILGVKNNSNTLRTGIQNTANSDNTDTNNDYLTAANANNAATQKANALRVANNAQDAIDNRIMQAGLDAPQEFGSFENGGHSTTRPLGMFANVVTESIHAIRRAGDEFLRYGYAYNGAWDFDGDWNVCEHFTYWKLSDFWVKGLNLPDAYMDRLRFFLFGGVTVWRNPEDIGRVTIYENMEG